MSKARSRMLLKHPFFANLALSTPLIETRDIPTAATDMANLYYNPDFVASLPNIETVMTLNAHEVAHIALLHGERLHERHHKIWNAACDYAINEMLVDADFEPIDGWLYDPRFKGMSADAIYQILMREHEQRQKQKPQQGDGQPQRSPDDQSADNDSDGIPQDVLGEDIQPSKSQTPDEAEAVRQSVKQRVAQAAAAARLAGKMSAGIERFVNQILHPPLPWLDILRDYMCRISQDDESWSRPNRRFQDVFMPSRHSLRMGPIIIIGDTSGSITNDELARIGTETAAIAEQLQPESIRIVWADTQVSSEQVFEQGDIITLKPTGYGGTDMRVPLEHVAQFEPQIVVLITDGYTPWPSVEPDYPLLVVCTTDVAVPVGEVIRI